MISSHFVPRASSASPVHARDSDSQKACNEAPSKDVVQPRVAPVEEETERKQTGAHCDACGAEDMRPAKVKAVVRGTVVPEIVHLGDGCSSTNTAHDERNHSNGCMPAASVKAVGDHQPKKDDNDRHDGR